MSVILEQRRETFDPERKSSGKPETKNTKRKITRGEKLIYSMAVPVILAFSFLIISNYATLYSLNHDKQTTETNITEQESMNDALALQVTELSDPDRILTIAQSELGMTMNDGQVHVVHQLD